MVTVIEGILNVDKPSGITSHDVVNQIRRLSGLRRVGHTGTLDPLATGVLLCCLGRATRLVEYLMGQPKNYLATIRLGQETNTYDAEGEIVAERPVTVAQADITEALEQFRGQISQRPPMFSAVKKEGQPLYKLARRGLETERPERLVIVYEITLLAWESPDVQVQIVCGAGAYVRSIAHDLGQRLGCGAHLRALRRTAIGDFVIENAVPLAHLSAEKLMAHLQSVDTAVRHLPRLNLSIEEATALSHGQQIVRQPEQPDAQVVRAYDAGGRFVGVVDLAGAKWQAAKIFYEPAQAG